MACHSRRRARERDEYTCVRWERRGMNSAATRRSTTSARSGRSSRRPPRPSRRSLRGEPDLAVSRVSPAGRLWRRGSRRAAGGRLTSAFPNVTIDRSRVRSYCRCTYVNRSPVSRRVRPNTWSKPIQMFTKLRQATSTAAGRSASGTVGHNGVSSGWSRSSPC